jgi:hypothetical protein
MRGLRRGWNSNGYPLPDEGCTSKTSPHVLRYLPDRLLIKRLLKTRCKGLVTLAIGPFTARETVTVCPRDATVLTSEELRRLSPLGCKFGFDVLVHVGQALFVRNRGVKEIVQDLREQNVAISEREVAYLGRKFIIYLSLAHLDSQERLKAACRLLHGMPKLIRRPDFQQKISNLLANVAS